MSIGFEALAYDLDILFAMMRDLGVRSVYDALLNDEIVMYGRVLQQYLTICDLDELSIELEDLSRVHASLDPIAGTLLGYLDENDSPCIQSLIPYYER